MRRETVSDLLAFVAVAREQSFTKAGKKSSAFRSPR
jgi:DNA-binding transcriptional LysR family regulator